MEPADGVPAPPYDLWLCVVEPMHVIEWPDEDVLVLSAASRLCSAWADNNSSVNSAMNEGRWLSAGGPLTSGCRRPPICCEFHS